MLTARNQGSAMRRLATVAAFAALILLNPHPGLTQTSDELKTIRQDIEALKKGQAANQRELQEIKGLLRARPAASPGEPVNVVLDIADAPFKGEKGAKLTLIDFSDYQ